MSRRRPVLLPVLADQSGRPTATAAASAAATTSELIINTDPRVIIRSSYHQDNCNEKERRRPRRSCFSLFPTTADLSMESSQQGLSDDNDQTLLLRRIQNLLNRRRRSQDSSCDNGEEHEYDDDTNWWDFDSFVLRGPFHNSGGELQQQQQRVGCSCYKPLTISPIVSLAIVHLFEQEEIARRRNTTTIKSTTTVQKRMTHGWKTLEVWDCQVNEPLLQVLHAAKNKAIFDTWEFRSCSAINRNCNNPFLTNNNNSNNNNNSLLKSFVWNHPTLKHLRLDGVVMDRPLVELVQGLFDFTAETGGSTTTTTTTTTTSAMKGADDGECDGEKVPTTRLQSLHLWGNSNNPTADTTTTTNTTDTMPLQNGQLFALLGAALQNNALTELSLVNCHQSPFLIPPSSLRLDSWMGRNHHHYHRPHFLQALNLSENYFSEAMLMTLGRILHHPTCRITTLVLDKCHTLTVTSRCMIPIRMEVLVKALFLVHEEKEDCHSCCNNNISRSSSSLFTLSLRENSVSSRDLEHLLKAIYRNGINLRVLDMTHNKIERIHWLLQKHHIDDNDLVAKQSSLLIEGGGEALNKSQQHESQLQDDATSMKSKFTTYRRSSSTTAVSTSKKETKPLLQCLWLTRNPILHNRFRARSAADNAKLECLLLRDFPSLGQILPPDYSSPNSRVMAFSTRVNTLLSFNYVGRGRLTHSGSSSCSDELLPLTLWTQALDRLARARSNLAVLLPSKDQQSLLQEQRIIRTCQASVIFLLLKHHPHHVTREACRKVEEHDDASNSCCDTVLVPSSANKKVRVPSKRRKIS